MSGDRIGPFGDWLAKYTSGALPTLPRQSHCGGALMYFTRDEALEAEEKGLLKYETDPRDMPTDGSRQSIRVRCRGEVMVKNGVTYGLCATCSGSELALRRKLQAEKDKAAKSSRESKSQRGDFDR